MTSTDGARRAVIYTRLSKIKERDRQAGNEDINTAEQEAKLRALAALRDLTVAGPAFTDNDLTAYKGSRRYKGRTGFDEMLKRLRVGDISVILVYQIYRLYRSHSDLEKLIEVCTAHGISIHTVSGGDMDLTTATGQMVAEFLASVGKQEVALMTERAVDGKARIRKAGRWPGGRVPYGYRVTGDFAKGTGAVCVDEAEADVIRGMCADVIRGMSLHEIARRLDAEGVRRPGKPAKPPGTHNSRRAFESWDSAEIGRMVRSPRYAALVTYKGEITGDGDWPAIIDQGTRDKVLAALDSRPGNRRGQRGRRHRWLLSGIARCGKCGSQNMRALQLINGRHGYSCRDCHGVSRDAERTNELVVDKVKRMLAHPAFAAAVKPAADVAALNTRREQIGRELEEWAATRTTPRAYRIATEPLYSELDRIEEKLSEAYRGTGLEDIAGAPDPAAKWPDLTITQQRAIVRALIDVTILPIKNTGDGPRMMGPQKGWKVGDPWFRPESVRIEPRQPASRR
jgi:site-specific DNA recombinase